MLIRCKTNKIKDIPQEYLKYHQTNYETDPILTEGKEYVVTGIEVEGSKVIFLAMLDNGTIGKTSSVLFEVVNNKIPDDWIAHFGVENETSTIAFSFPEWFTDGFIWNYYEQKRSEVELVNLKVKKYSAS
jgi:hypothetical protein